MFSKRFSRAFIIYLCRFPAFFILFVTIKICALIAYMRSGVGFVDSIPKLWDEETAGLFSAVVAFFITVLISLKILIFVLSRHNHAAIFSFAFILRKKKKKEKASARKNNENNNRLFFLFLFLFFMSSF